MAKAPYVRTRWTFVALIVVVLILIIGTPLEVVLLPDWNWTLTAGWNWLWANTGIIMVIIIIIAADAFFRANTRHLVTTDKEFTLAYYSPKNLQSRYYRLDRAYVRRMTRTTAAFPDFLEDQKDGHSIIDLEPTAVRPVPGKSTAIQPRDLLPTAVQPFARSLDASSQSSTRQEELSDDEIGSDQKGRYVPLVMLVLGGIDYAGIHLKGHDGILLVYGGEDEFIRFGQAHKGTSVVLPRMLLAVPHSAIDPEVMNQLRQIDTFKEGKTPIFIATTYDPNFIEYLRAHADVFLPILQKVDQKKLKNGRPDEHFLWMENLSLRSELQSVKHERDSLIHANRAYSDVAEGRAVKMSRQYRRDTDQDPNLIKSRETPLESDQ